MHRETTPSALALLLVLAGCGDDADPPADGTSTAPTTDDAGETGPSTTGTASTSTMSGTTAVGESSSTGMGESGSSGGEASSSSSGAPIVCNEVTPGGPSFVDTVWPILEGRCSGALGCHQDGDSSLMLTLDMDVAYDNLVCVEAVEADLFRVDPGNPEGSYWLAKLRGTQVDVGGMGSQMPLAGTPLEPSELATIQAWIEGGANP